MILVDERSRDDRLERVELSLEDGLVAMYLDHTCIGALPIDAVIQVMRRYGRPLESDVVIPDGGLQLSPNTRLTMMRFLARYDVIGRDWLVLVTPDENVGELAVTVVPALEHLARRFRNVVT